MPEKNHRDEEAGRAAETSEQTPEAPLSAPPSVSIPLAPDSKRERQMTDFPDGD